MSDNEAILSLEVQRCVVRLQEGRVNIARTMVDWYLKEVDKWEVMLEVAKVDVKKAEAKVEEMKEGNKKGDEDVIRM